MENTKKIIDISGMSKEEVKELMKLENYNMSNFSRVWKRQTMLVTTTKK